MQKESMHYDVVIVGAGPSGLSCACKLKQLNPELSVCILEKGSEVGAQILSGAVFEPRALNELFPDWKERGAPLTVSVESDEFLFLTKNGKIKLPTPKPMHNDGNFIIRLSELCKWLSEQAEKMGVDIFTGFAATQFIIEEGRVKGVVTGDKGVDKTGQLSTRYQPGYELYAKQVVLAEGCRGSLTKFALEKFNLQEHCDPQSYGIGIKELWEVNPTDYKPGTVMHSVGWPLDNKTYGGAFVYHLDQNQVAIGFVVGLDYQNPYLSPFEEFQQFKRHPSISGLLKNGKRLCYGARALTEGGLQSLPKLIFPGGLIVGDSAGFLNVPKIKGSHTSMKSGMLAAEAIVLALQEDDRDATSYPEKIKSSWVWAELKKVRNIRPAFRAGLIVGLVYAALDTYLFNGRAPWTFKNKADYKSLLLAKKSKRIDYPKPDNQITFDRLSSVYLSNTRYEENQPCHLQLKNTDEAITVNYRLYDSPESRYCPAGVYEILKNENNEPYLQINFTNCIQCKTCDIKDPRQNINWIPPEGGDGPNYTGM